MAISKKRKGTFLNSSRVSSHKKRKSSFGITSSTHSTSHVVFQNTNSLSVADSRTASSLSNLKDVKKKQGTSKRSGGNSSLWSRVSASRFRKR